MKRVLFLLLCFVAFSGSAQVLRNEYYFDTDPGFGQGSQLPFTTGAMDTTFTFSAGISSLSNGLHRFFVRSYDSVHRAWSLTAPKFFYKEALLSNPLLNIVKGEYFFDTDPGFGAASIITVTPGQDISFSFSGSISALSNGLHRLVVRTQDAAGRWSTSTPQLFYKEALLSNPPANITAAEYFFDTDPGFGAATTVSVTLGTDITFPITASIITLSNGLHRLYVRTKDAAGKWSMSAPQIFYKDATLSNPLVNITKLEYFFDTDPGFGAATNVPVTPGLDITINFNAGISTLSNGLHNIAVRSRDANGKWSLTSQQLFYREAVLSNLLVNIIKAEYFFDSDPGFGSGTNVPVAAGQDITFTFSAGMASLSNGLHRLYLRTKDANGKWSISAAQLFYKEPVLSNPLVNITKAEYFFDTDPGFGSGVNVPLTAGQDVAIAFTGSIAALGNGLHRMVVRTRDANGKWSMSTPQLFYKDVITTHTPGNLVKMEWFWDTDPGFGNATAITIPAGNTELQNYNFNVAVPSSFSNQIHNLYVRTQDDWGLTTVKTVDFTGIALPLTLLDFSARREASRVRIDWRTAMEQNMEKYVVERSTDAVNFTAIGEQKSTANGSGGATYNLYDEHPAQGMNYYRLREIELAGNIKYSPVAPVLFSDGADNVRVYPNPATDDFTISSSQAISRVTLMDMAGKTVAQFEPDNSYSLNGIPAGAYFVKVLVAGNTVVTKTIVVR